MCSCDAILSLVNFLLVRTVAMAPPCFSSMVDVDIRHKRLASIAIE